MSSILDDPEARLLRWYGLAATPLWLISAVLMISFCDYRIAAPICVLASGLFITGATALGQAIHQIMVKLRRWWRLRRDFPRVRVVR